MEEVVLQLEELLFPSIADVAVLSVAVNDDVSHRRGIPGRSPLALAEQSGGQPSRDLNRGRTRPHPRVRR
ncbi:hypothetical protein [Streptomyces sp. NPDC005525]|uniref:hypothetical protein n=1 Tax=Streptomyces sp. NPDC005525 TaxID=3364720 RepID=UPI0036AB8893